MSRSDISTGPGAAGTADGHATQTQSAQMRFHLPEGSGAEAPVFAEPWQAQAFALAVALNQRGLFTWSEWATALSREVSKPGAAPDGGDYYCHWLAALEALLAQKGVAGAGLIDDLAASWQRAARATPHGHPIRLENDPERG